MTQRGHSHQFLCRSVMSCRREVNTYIKIIRNWRVSTFGTTLSPIPVLLTALNCAGSLNIAFYLSNKKISSHFGRAMCDWDMFLLSVTEHMWYTCLLPITAAGDGVTVCNTGGHSWPRNGVRVTLAPQPSRFNSRSYTLIIPDIITHYSFIDTIDPVYDFSGI